jgi:hypothetical protein
MSARARLASRLACPLSCSRPAATDQSNGFSASEPRPGSPASARPPATPRAPAPAPTDDLRPAHRPRHRTSNPALRRAHPLPGRHLAPPIGTTRPGHHPGGHPTDPSAATGMDTGMDTGPTPWPPAWTPAAPTTPATAPATAATAARPSAASPITTASISAAAACTAGASPLPRRLRERQRLQAGRPGPLRLGPERQRGKYCGGTLMGGDAAPSTTVKTAAPPTSRPAERLQGQPAGHRRRLQPRGRPLQRRRLGRRPLLRRRPARRRPNVLYHCVGKATAEQPDLRRGLPAEPPWRARRLQEGAKRRRVLPRHPAGRRHPELQRLRRRRQPLRHRLRHRRRHPDLRRHGRHRGRLRARLPQLLQQRLQPRTAGTPSTTSRSRPTAATPTTPPTTSSSTISTSTSLGPGVANGTHLDQGQLIANSGNSGCSSGPHIHIETASVPKGKNATLNTCASVDPDRATVLDPGPSPCRPRPPRPPSPHSAPGSTPCSLSSCSPPSSPPGRRGAASLGLGLAALLVLWPLALPGGPLLRGLIALAGLLGRRPRSSTSPAMPRPHHARSRACSSSSPWSTPAASAGSRPRLDPAACTASPCGSRSASPPCGTGLAHDPGPLRWALRRARHVRPRRDRRRPVSRDPRPPRRRDPADPPHPDRRHLAARVLGRALEPRRQPLAARALLPPVGPPASPRIGLGLAFLASAAIHAWFIGVALGPRMAACMGLYFVIRAPSSRSRGRSRRPLAPLARPASGPSPAPCCPAPLFVEPILRLVAG